MEIIFFIIELVNAEDKKSKAELSIMLLTLILSPILTYIIIYQPNLLECHDYESTTMLILLLTYSGCLFTIIYYFSYPFSTYIEIRAGRRKKDVSICLHKLNMVTASIFMLILSIAVICHYSIRKINLICNIEWFLLSIIIIYISFSILVYILYVKKQLHVKKKKELDKKLKQIDKSIECIGKKIEKLDNSMEEINNKIEKFNMKIELIRLKIRIIEKNNKK